MPKIYKSKFGFTCSCSKYFGGGATRAIAFQEWQKLARSKCE